MDVVELMVDEGASVIFTTSDSFEEDTNVVAAAFPDVTFINITGSNAIQSSDVVMGEHALMHELPELPSANVGNFNTYMELPRMIAGCAAALASETGHIGYLGALINPETRRLVASSYLGARYCADNYRDDMSADDITFEVKWIGFWFHIPGVTLDPVEVAQQMLDGGADVIISGIDTTEAITVAGRYMAEGDMSYGVPYGNINGCSEAPEACLGSAYYNWGPAYLSVVERVVDGSWAQEWLWWEPKWDEIGDDGFYTDADYSVGGYVFGDGLSMEHRETLKTFAQAIHDFQTDPMHAGEMFLWSGPLNLQDGTQLGQEELRLVPADADPAPAQERVVLGGCAKEDGELVSPEVEGADDNGPGRKRLRHRPVGTVLLLLAGHRAAAHDQEFGAKEPHPLRAQSSRPGRLGREVEIDTQRHALAVQGHRLLSRARRLLVSPSPDRGAAALEASRFRGVRFDHDPSGNPVHDDRLAVPGPGADVPEPRGGGDLQRPCEDRPVRGSRSPVGGQAHHPGGVDAGHEAGREVPGHCNDSGRAILRRPGIGKVQQPAQHPDLEVFQIVQPVQHHGVGGARPALLQLHHAPLEGAGGGKPALRNVAPGPLDDLGVVQHQDLRVEDAGLDGTEPGLGVALDVLEIAARPREGSSETLGFTPPLPIGNRQVRRLGNFPHDAPHPPPGDSLRCGQTVEDHRSGRVIHRSRP